MILITLITAMAFAQEPAKELGWKKTSQIGVNLSFTSSQDVVGQTDGNSETYGLNFKNQFRHVGEWNEWQTDALYAGTTTRTPSIPRYVKSSDELKISTAFLHFWDGNPKFGPYARAELSTPVFKGENVQSEAKTYRIIPNNGAQQVFTGTSVRLTDGFKPLTTKESAGFFWRPRDDERMKIETRFGVAALQVSASGQYTVKGTNDAGEIEVIELRDINQFGLEAAASIKGKISDNSGYEVGTEVLTPLVNNQEDSDDRDALRLTNIDSFVKLTSNITSWAAFGYDYRVKIQPQLVDRAQQIHMIVLNVNYNLL